MTVDPDAQYLAELDAEAKALDDEETALETKYKAAREDIAARRASTEHARQHFLAFLEKKGKGLAAPVQQTLLGANTNQLIPLPVRMGEQRRLVLDAVAATRDGLTAREITKATGVASKVVYTYAQREIAAGIFTRFADRLALTGPGRDYLVRCAAKFGPAPKPKAPPAQAGGALQ